VPVAIRNPRLPPDAATAYDEESVKAGALGMLEGDRFIRLALGR
jgi:2,3-bisphosphoglycerate-independent phosphoglycerate mutase